MSDYLERIERALQRAREVVGEFTPGRIASELKSGGDPVTAADVALDAVLREELLRDGEGWLSEETVDDLSRLEKQRVWIVDPLDGTREFIQGIPEWCISIALVEGGEVIAAGICSPPNEQVFLGTRAGGVTLNGKSARVSEKPDVEGATVLASRSEVKRGEWERFMDGPLEVVPMGSVAYKLARVSAGLADATFTLVPKNEWDVAAGSMLVEAAGGNVLTKEGEKARFNKENTLFTGFVASGSALFEPLFALTRE